jgi:hypothetical protein
VVLLLCCHKWYASKGFPGGMRAGACKKYRPIGLALNSYAVIHISSLICGWGSPMVPLPNVRSWWGSMLLPGGGAQYGARGSQTLSGPMSACEVVEWFRQISSRSIIKVNFEPVRGHVLVGECRACGSADSAALPNRRVTEARI